MPRTATRARRARSKTSVTAFMPISMSFSATLSAKSGAWIRKAWPPSCSAIWVATWLTSV